MAGDIPFLTAKHAHHSAVWTIKGFSTSEICVACAIEMLQDGQTLAVQVRRIIEELQAFMKSGDSALRQVLSTDKRVQEHLMNAIFTQINPDNTSISVSGMCIDALDTLIEFLNCQDLSEKLLQQVIQKIMASSNFPNALAHLTLTGRLLHSNPPLSEEVIHAYRGFLEYLISGLGYPDEAVKSNVAYILVQIANKADLSSLPASFIQTMCRHTSAGLASAKCYELTSNLLGLTRSFVKCNRYMQCLIQLDQLASESKGPTLAVAFKRVLLHRDEVLQLSAVQCLQEVLIYHPNYAQVLVKADIAEFLCEGLKTKNESLLSALFLCLSTLANADEFHSNCHIIYVIDPVISGINAALWLRSHQVMALGFTLLSKIFKKQVEFTSLIMTTDLFSKLLSAMDTALECKSPVLTLQIAASLSPLLRIENLLLNGSQSQVLRLLAMLFEMVDPLSKPTNIQPTLNQFMRHLLIETLNVTHNMYHILTKCSKENKSKHLSADEVIQFLNSGFEEVLLPAVLLNYNNIEEPEPVTIMFTIAKVRCIVCHDEAPQWAARLASSGFIQLSLDIKSKYYNTKWIDSLCTAANELLVEMCTVLEATNSSGAYVRDILGTSLPHVPFNISTCLQLLNQRASNLAYGGLNRGSNTIHDTQSAILLLLHNAFAYGDKLVTLDVLLKALEGYLFLNPDIHLLPPRIFICILVLYSLAESNSEKNQLSPSREVMVRGLQRVSKISSVFVPSECVVLWLFNIQTLVMCAGKDWLLEWLKVSRHQSDLINALAKCQPMLECFLELLVSPEVQMHTNAIVEILTDLIEKAGINGAILSNILVILERITHAQRLDPLSELSNAAILKILQVLLSRAAAPPISLKLVHHVASIAARAELELSSDAVVATLEFLNVLLPKYEQLCPQAPIVLISNPVFLQKISSCLSKTHLSHGHDQIAVPCMNLIAELIQYQHLPSNVHLQNEVVEIWVETLMEALLSRHTPLQSAIHLWKAILYCKGYGGFFTIKSLVEWKENLARVMFFIINSLIGPSILLRERAAECFVELLNYAETLNQWKGILHRQWGITFLNFLSDMFHGAQIPNYYVVCVTKVLQFCEHLLTPLELKSLAQLIYSSFVSQQAVLREDQQVAYMELFQTLGKQSRDLFTESEWEQISYNSKALH